MGVQIDRVEAEVVEPPAAAVPQPPPVVSDAPTPSPAAIELALKRLAAREARRRAE